MIATDINKTATVRNVFIIDDKGIIRLILVYPMNVGRCIPEILRAIQALQVADCSNGSTPANWVPCNQVIRSIPKTFDQLLERNEELAKNRDGLTWYLGFKKPENCCKKLNDNSENT